MRVTVIVPFHRNLEQLARCLPAVRRSAPGDEIIVAADGAESDCRPLAAAVDAVVVDVPGPSGPATARNRAAARATGDVLVFVDADVVVAPDAIPGMRDLLSGEPGVAAVFGAYDLSPPARNFMSQFKNLSHRYVHEVGNPDASTFWAGLGAVRTTVFRSLGGFDERFARPSIEDIELGCRMVAAGHRIRLAPRLQGTHLKRWTLWSCITTDIMARGVPWVQLIHRSGQLSNDLNTRVELRLSVAVACGVVAAIGAMALTPWAAVGALALLATLVGLNLQYYRWLARQRGLAFALRAVPAHLVHHWCNAVSFVIGTVLHAAGRIGLQLPGALPRSTWSAAGAPVRTAAGARS